MNSKVALSVMWLAVFGALVLSGALLCHPALDYLKARPHLRTLQTKPTPLPAGESEWYGTGIDAYAAHKFAAKQLARMGPCARAAVPTLLDLLKSDDEVLRTIAAQALQEIAPNSLEGLERTSD